MRLGPKAGTSITPLPSITQPRHGGALWDSLQPGEDRLFGREAADHLLPVA